MLCSSSTASFFGSIASTFLCAHLFVIFIERILRHTRDLERVQFDDIRLASAICRRRSPFGLIGPCHPVCTGVVLSRGKSVPIKWGVSSCFCGRGSGSYSQERVKGEIMRLTLSVWCSAFSNSHYIRPW